MHPMRKIAVSERKTGDGNSTFQCFCQRTQSFLGEHNTFATKRKGFVRGNAKNLQETKSFVFSIQNLQLSKHFVSE